MPRNTNPKRGKARRATRGLKALDRKIGRSAAKQSGSGRQAQKRAARDLWGKNNPRNFKEWYSGSSGAKK
jgi:hypothetical protein